MEKAYHQAVYCKECNTGNAITGWRHKCLNCANYDLCEICFKYTKHDAMHVFATFKSRCDFTLTELTQPILKTSLYRQISSSLSTPVCEFVKQPVIKEVNLKPNTFAFSPPTTQTSSAFNFGSGFSSATSLFGFSNTPQSRLPIASDITMDG